MTRHSLLVLVLALAVSKAHATGITTVSSGSAVVRVPVTGDTTLTGTLEISAEVSTLSANLTVTMPAAPTSGQRVTVVDATGTGGTANYLIKIAPNSGHTIEGMSAIIIDDNYGSVSLAFDGTNKWHVYAARGGWGIDPRTITGLKHWYDARRGITITGSGVSSWLDLVGAANATQSTDNLRPTLVEGAYRGRPAILNDGTNDVLNIASTTYSSGSLTTIAMISQEWSKTLENKGVASFAQGNINAIQSIDSGGQDWITGDSVYFANGFTSGTAPRMICMRPIIQGQEPLLSTVRFGAANSKVWHNGSEVPVYRVRVNGAVTTNTGASQIFISNASTATRFGMLFMIFDAGVSDANVAELHKLIDRSWGIP